MISDFFGKCVAGGPAKTKRVHPSFRKNDRVVFMCDKEGKPVHGLITRIKKSYRRVRVSRTNRQWVAKTRLLHSNALPIAMHERLDEEDVSDSSEGEIPDVDCPPESDVPPPPPELGNVGFAQLVEALLQQEKVPQKHKGLVNDLKNKCTPDTEDACMRMLCGTVPHMREVDRCLGLIGEQDNAPAPAIEEEVEDSYVVSTSLLDSDDEDEQDVKGNEYAAPSSMACSGDESEQSEGSARATPQPPPKKKGKEKAAAKNRDWGCSRCRWRITGCTSKRCNPKPGAKEDKARKKTEKEAARAAKLRGNRKSAIHKKSKPKSSSKPKHATDSAPEADNDFSTLLDSDNEQEQEQEQAAAAAATPMEEDQVEQAGPSDDGAKEETAASLHQRRMDTFLSSDEEEQEEEQEEQEQEQEEEEPVTTLSHEEQKALHRATQNQRKLSVDALKQQRVFFYDVKRDNANFKIMNRYDSLIPLTPNAVGHDEICAWLAEKPTTEPVKKLTAHMLFVVLTAETTLWPGLAAFLEYAKDTPQEAFSKSVAETVYLCKLDKMGGDDKKRVIGLMDALHVTAKALA